MRWRIYLDAELVLVYRPQPAPRPTAPCACACAACAVESFDAKPKEGEKPAKSRAERLGAAWTEAKVTPPSATLGGNKDDAAHH